MNKEITGSEAMMKALQAEGRDRLVMATIIARQGSSPRGVGSKMLIAKDGSIIGTIGGGLVEGSAIARGKQMLQDEERGAVAMERGAMTMECGPAVMERRPAIMDVDMSAGAAEEDGMVCGGRVQVLLEIV
jgi:xanthine dehydrogenase accessory factor